MSRVGLLLLALAASVVGLVGLTALLASTGIDIVDLARTWGWLAVVVVLAWPALMTAGMIVHRD